MKISGHASPAATLAVIFTSSAFAIIAVVLRLWTRLGIVKQPGWDDLLVTLSLFFTLIFTVCVAFEVYHGLGRHIDTLSKYDLTQLCLWLWISVWNYYIGLGLAKLSIVIQCLRIFGHIRWFRIASYVLAAVIIAFTIFSTFISIFLCQPVSHFWQLDRPGKCLDRLPLWLFNSAFTMLTDILVTLLPLPVVKSLQLPRRQRYILMCVFGLGGVICIVSVVRLSGIYATSVTKDVSYENSQAALYSNLEAAVGIIASCVPTLTAFVKTYFPRLFHTSSTMESEATELSEMSGKYNKIKEKGVGGAGSKKGEAGVRVHELESGEAWRKEGPTMEHIERAREARANESRENLVT